jgi:O-antigen/teichoic acid export membrane protein
MIGRATSFLYLSISITSILNFIGLYFLTTNLGSTNYGNLLNLLSIVIIINGLSDLGFSTAHVKKISEGQELSDCISTFTWIKIVLTSFFVLIIVLGTLAYIVLYNKSVFDTDVVLLLLFAGYYVLYDLSMIATYTFNGRAEMVKSQMVSLMDPVVRVPLIILVLFLGLPIVYIGVAYFLTGVAILLAATYLLWSVDFQWRKPTLAKQYRQFALPIALTAFIAVAIDNLDKIFVKLGGGAQELGYYGIAKSVVGMLIGIGIAMTLILLPTFSELHTKGKSSQMSDMCWQTERYSIFLFLPLVVYISVLSSPIIVFIFHSEYSNAGPILTLLVISAFVNLVNLPRMNQLYAMNRSDLAAKSTVISFAVFILLLLALTPTNVLGIRTAGLLGVGAAIAAIAQSLVFFMLTRYFVAKMSGERNNPRLFLYIGIGVIGGIVFGLIRYIVPLEGISLLVVLLPVSYLLTLGLLMVLKQFSRDDLRTILDLINIRKMWHYISKESRNGK